EEPALKCQLWRPMRRVRHRWSSEIQSAMRFPSAR
ncbi:hypothetical protein ACV35P_32670, partial [Pseudomonas aeruginosa]